METKIAVYECETCGHYDATESRCPYVSTPIPGRVVGGCEHWRQCNIDAFRIENIGRDAFIRWRYLERERLAIVGDGLRLELDSHCDLSDAWNELCRAFVGLLAHECKTQGQDFDLSAAIERLQGG